MKSGGERPRTAENGREWRRAAENGGERWTTAENGGEQWRMAENGGERRRGALAARQCYLKNYRQEQSPAPTAFGFGILRA